MRGQDTRTARLPWTLVLVLAFAAAEVVGGLVVEGSQYTSPDGQLWSAGGAALATRLP